MIEADTFRVISSSGKSYTVTYVGGGDDDPRFVGFTSVWNCTCPSREMCHHILAVAAWVDADEEEPAVRDKIRARLLSP